MTAQTVAVGPGRTAGTGRPPVPRPALARWASWSAALVAVVGVVALLRRYDTPVPVTLAFGAAWLLLLTLPGTLLWRALRGSPRSLVEDVAMGSALGLAAQALLAFALSPFGLAPWSAAWAPVVVLTVTVHPRLRHVWHQRTPAVPASAAWATSGAVLASALWVAVTSFATNPVRYVDGVGLAARAAPVATYIDMPYHQSLTAGVQTWWPLVYPYLYDEPLTYHLFAYEHLATLATVTGVDLTWVVYRLHTLPLVALAVVLAGVLAARLSSSPAAGPLGAVLAALTSAVSPYSWSVQPFFSPGILTFSTFRSPTHTVGVCLFLAALVVTVMLLREWPTSRWRLLPVLAVLALAAGGSKSTLLPVLACAALLVAAVGLLRRQAHWRAAAAVLGLSVVAFAFVALAVIGTSTDRVAIDPGALLDRVPAAAAAGVLAEVPGSSALVLGLSLLSWLLAGAGGLLLLRRRTIDEPALWLLGGVLVAGVCAALLTSANGVSQLYFLYAAWPALPVLSAWGLAETLGRREGLVLTTAGLLGVTAALVLARRTPTAAPEPATSLGGAAATLLPAWGVLALLVAAAVLLTGVAALPRRAKGRLALLVPILVAVLVGTSVGARTNVVVDAVPQLGAPPPPLAEGIVVADGLAPAALWLRDASKPDDVVATNAHCYGAPSSCDARHFLVSALTERRVLVEGWAYPDGGDRGRPWARTNPFWDTERYEQNEAVFTRPTQEAVDLLAEQYGVRWLFVDRSVYEESEELRRFAELVHEADGFAVYALG